MSRGLRNNNPGNIRLGRTQWKGEIRPSRDKEFCTFSSRAWGYRAMMRLIRNYVELNGCHTLQAIIYRWAPPVENSSSSYVEAVCRLTGMNPQSTVDPTDRDQMIGLAAAMSRVENGVDASRAEVEDGWALL